MILGLQHISAQKFFSSTTYKGAFNTVDWTTGWTNWNPRNTSYPAPNVTVTGEITNNTTWTANKTYLISGYVYVKNGATLTIEPGTIIRGEQSTTGTLVITRGAKIVAVGTKDLPIIFTSAEAAGSRNYGDWGGLLLLGKAKINVVGGTADVGAGINNSNSDGVFGGTDDEDSSGVLKYVRIEFAGVQYQPDKEINGLTLAALGSKTKVDYVMLSLCGNDAFRFAGGKIKSKYLISNKCLDNDFVMDLGYTGALQFGVIQRDSSKAYSLGASSLVVENDALGTNAAPNTFPVLSNFTFLGPMTSPTTLPNSNYRYGIHLRRNAKLGFFNSAVAGYPRNIMLDGSSVGTNLAGNSIIFQNNAFAGFRLKHIDSTNKFTIGAPGVSPLSWLSHTDNSNVLSSNPKDLKYVKPYDYTTPIFVLGSGSPLSSDASFAHPLLGGIVSTKNFTQQKSDFWISNSNNSVSIQNKSNFQSVKTIQIYSINGKLILNKMLTTEEQNFNEIVIPNTFTSGIFVFVFEYQNGLKQTLKSVF